MEALGFEDELVVVAQLFFEEGEVVYAAIQVLGRCTLQSVLLKHRSIVTFDLLLFKPEQLESLVDLGGVLDALGDAVLGEHAGAGEVQLFNGGVAPGVQLQSLLSYLLSLIS